MRNAVLLAIIVVMAGLAACSDTTTPEPDLEARVSLSLLEFENINPLSFYFVFDPTISISRLGPVDSLRVRWDMDGVPGWDSDFLPMRRWVDFRWFPLPSRTWSARIEVIDRFGNSSTATKTIVLPDGVPEPPDLVTGDLLVTTERRSWVQSDTISVGQDFYVVLPARFWGNRRIVDCRFTCSIDDEYAGSSIRGILGPCADFSNTGSVGAFVVSEPGTHEIAVDVQVLEGVEELDRDNNRKVRSVVFVGGSN